MKLMSTMLLAGALLLPAGASFAHGDRQSMNEDDYINQPVHLDETFQRTSADCNYTVRVYGNVRPVSSEGNAKVPSVDPRVDVVAEAKCPNVESAKLTSHILGVQPLTWRQLADSISQRSRVLTVEQDHQCTYKADFRLINTKLEMNRFDHSCQSI